MYRAVKAKINILYMAKCKGEQPKLPACSLEAGNGEA